MDEVCRKYGIDLREIDASARNAKPLLPIAKPPAKADIDLDPIPTTVDIQTLETPPFKTISGLLNLTSQLSQFMSDSRSLLYFDTTSPFPLPHHSQIR